MKLERSGSLLHPWQDRRDGKSSWRVTSWYFSWGPYCYTRREAIWKWINQIGLRGKGSFGEFLSMPLVRLIRWSCFGCLTCGRSIRASTPWTDIRVTSFLARYRYCSMDCASYDGALKEPKRSWILFGRLVDPKVRHDAELN